MNRQVFPTRNPAVRKALQATNRNNVKSYFQPLYHYQEYAALGHSTLSFFGRPYTQTPGGLDDTNMAAAGQLLQKSVEVTAVELLFLPAASPKLITDVDAVKFVQDTYNVFRSGRLEFTVNSQLVLQDGPVGMFAAPSRLYAEGTAYASMVGPLYRITNLVIPMNTNFSVDLKWNTPAPISAAARIGIRLQTVESRTS